MSGNQFKIQPLDLYQVTDATGSADALRITTADGTAAGTVASSTTSTYMSGNQFKIQPLDLYQITDATGSADVLRITTASGTATGTLPSSTTSMFSSANEFKVVPLSSHVVRNNDDTQDVLRIDTLAKNAETVTLSHGGTYVLNVDGPNGLKLKDDKIEIRPGATMDVLGSGGGMSIIRVDNTPGAGSEVLTLAAHTVDFVGSDAVTVRNKDGTLPVLTLDASFKQQERFQIVSSIFVHNGGQSLITSIGIDAKWTFSISSQAVTATAGVAVSQGSSTGVLATTLSGTSNVQVVVTAAAEVTFDASAPLTVDGVLLTGNPISVAVTSSNVATVIHDGGIDALSLGDRVVVTGSHGQTNGEHVIASVIDGTRFTFALTTTSASYSGGVLKRGATLSVDRAIGTRLQDDKIELRPESWHAVTDSSGGDVSRMRTDTGIASGTIASPSSSTFLSGNQIKTVLLDKLTIRNKDDTSDILVVDTSSQDNEIVSIDAEDILVAPTGHFQISDRTRTGAVLRAQSSAAPLTLVVASVSIAGGTTATVSHQDTGGQAKVLLGDKIIFSNLASITSLNEVVWTVTGTPTPTTFTIATTESGRVSPADGTYAGKYNGEIATATVMYNLDIASVIVTSSNAIATVTHAEASSPLLTPLSLSATKVDVSGGNLATVTHAASPAGSSTSPVRAGDSVTLSGIVTKRSTIRSVAVTSNVATATHTGGLSSLSTSDRVTISGNDASTDGTYQVVSVGALGTMTFTFSLSVSDGVFAGGTAEITTNSILNNIWTVTGVPGATSFTFATTELTRNSPPNGVYVLPAGVVSVRRALTITSIVVDGQAGGPGGVVATVTHSDDTSVRMLAGQVVEISGYTAGGKVWANRRWTVLGQPTSTTLRFAPSEDGRDLPDDGTYTPSVSAIIETYVTSSEPRVQAGSSVTLAGMAESSLNKAWTVVGRPTSTEFKISITELGRTKPSETTHLPTSAPASGSIAVTTTRIVTTTAATVAVDASTLVSGEYLDLVSTRSTSFLDRDGERDVVRVDTSSKGAERVSLSGRFQDIGDEDTVLNRMLGGRTTIGQSNSVFRPNVLEIDDDHGFVVTDDHVVVTPMVEFRVTDDGGMRDVLSLSTTTYSTIGMTSDNIVGGCANAAYTTPETCTTQGIWTADVCSNPAYTSSAACTNQGTWSTSCSPVNNNGRETSQAACEAVAATWTPGSCKINGVPTLSGGRETSQAACVAAASSWTGGDKTFTRGDTWTNANADKRGYVYETTTRGSLKYVSTRGTPLSNNEVVITEDGDSLTTSGTSSPSNTVTGVVSTPDGFTFDAKAAKDTWVEIKNTFSTSGHP